MPTKDVPDEQKNSTALASTPAANTAHEYGLSVLKGLIGAIPYAGTLVNEVLFEARSRLKQQRLESFFASVAEQVGRLADESIDRDYVRSEEFSDLLEDLVFRVTRTRSESKRQCFRTILVKGFAGTRTPDFAALFMSILEEMSDEELRICEIYYHSFRAVQERRATGSTAVEVGPIDYKQDKIFGVEPSTLKQIVQALIRKGLLFDDSYGKWGPVPFTSVELTELGASFYEWISSPPAATHDHS